MKRANLLSFLRSNYHRERCEKLTFRSCEGLTLETPAFQIFHDGKSTFVNPFDKTKFSFRNYNWCCSMSAKNTW